VIQEAVVIAEHKPVTPMDTGAHAQERVYATPLTRAVILIVNTSRQAPYAVILTGMVV